VPAKIYGTRVSTVDSDGNEVAGLRLPPIAAQLATYTACNLYGSEPSELCDRDGSYVPFPKTKPSARQQAIRAPRSGSATARARSLWRRSRRPTRSLLSGCRYWPKPQPTWRQRKRPTAS